MPGDDVGDHGGPGGADSGGGGDNDVQNQVDTFSAFTTGNFQNTNFGGQPVPTNLSIGPQKEAPQTKGGLPDLDRTFNVPIHNVDKVTNVPTGKASGGLRGILGQTLAEIEANPVAATIASAIPGGVALFAAGTATGVLDNPVAGHRGSGSQSPTVTTISPNTTPSFGDGEGDGTSIGPVKLKPRKPATVPATTANNNVSLNVPTRSQIRSARRKVVRSF